MEVWHVMGLRTPLREIAERARRVEDMGFDVLAVPDIIHDGPISAALAVAATRRMRIATSGLIAFPRSPMMVAVAAWDLQESSDGRFLLGLGPQVRGNIVSRYGTTWTPPAPRMREYVQSLRAIFDRWQHGTPLDFRGEHYRFTRMQPFTSPLPIEHPEIPIHLAGIGPNMTALAGELAEGLMTHPTSASPRFLGEFTRPHLERGASVASSTTRSASRSTRSARRGGARPRWPQRARRIGRRWPHSSRRPPTGRAWTSTAGASSASSSMGGFVRSVGRTWRS